ncbi:MAG: calcium-translocating P-type ATPase, PMCA-type [Candidatus Margulisbacteria bacterium]|nr:calcium-translocating P-type ATPase, PMCA-type [Candidatus Margulisiibacteriota bacterium]
MDKWWEKDTPAIAGELESNLTSGLSSSQVLAKLTKYGPNQLLEKKGRSPLSIFLDQFKDFIIWVLIGAGLVSGFLKEWIDAAAIIAIVIINAIMGFIQEYRAEKSLAALKKLSSPNSKVIRDGQLVIIPSSHLVPGDLIELEAGDNIPADCRAAYLTPSFACHEASLTGESTPVEKTSLALKENNVPLAERANMLYMGTAVVSGKGRAIVVETGMHTELGKIAGMLQQIEQETTPLQKKLEEFGKWIVYLCFGLVAMIFLLGYWRGGDVLELFLTAVSLAVAAIPEGLPAVVTIALALGIQRMVKRHVLIRKLPAVETLGSASVICSDKTGTLTKNEMTVQAIEAADTNQALTCAVLCNGAQIKEDSKYVGDPTEIALLVAAKKAGIEKGLLEKEYSFVEEIPFDSVRRKMTIVRQKGQEKFAFVKGAPEAVLANCVLSETDRQKIAQSNADLASQAMRVLALAMRPLNAGENHYSAEAIENELIFLGLIAMLDPPREEVKTAIADCVTAGIKTVMITGDHKNTAVAIAKQLGFFKENSLAITGEELDRLNDEEFKSKLRNICVYARVSPENKLRIVRAWRQAGEVVAMTGDGVNDAPAVKEADIGVAMGITGTDVTKEVSDMVITDDNFASIVAAVEEGRGIFDNIRKFVHYLLSCNAGEILVMFAASLFGLPTPLLPIHILWVNLITDGLPALALGTDPVDPNVMRRPPRPAKEAVITGERARRMLLQGSFIAFCSLAAFLYILLIEDGGLGRARTGAFIVLACSQLFHAFNCRSESRSLFSLGITTNLNLVWAALFSFMLQMAVIYTPFLQMVFKTEPLGLFDWFLVIALSSLPLWGVEFIKLRKQLTTQYSH